MTLAVGAHKYVYLAAAHIKVTPLCPRYAPPGPCDWTGPGFTNPRPSQSSNALLRTLLLLWVDEDPEQQPAAGVRGREEAGVTSA